MTFFIVAVLLAAFAFLMWSVLRQMRRRPTNAAADIDLDLLRIEQSKRLAMDDIRRRRQYAEDQIHRLARWSR